MARQGGLLTADRAAVLELATRMVATVNPSLLANERGSVTLTSRFENDAGHDLRLTAVVHAELAGLEQPAGPHADELRRRLLDIEPASTPTPREGVAVAVDEPVNDVATYDRNSIGSKYACDTPPNGQHKRRKLKSIGGDDHEGWKKAGFIPTPPRG